jgi:hypothetical protein
MSFSILFEEVFDGEKASESDQSGLGLVETPKPSD